MSTVTVSKVQTAFRLNADLIRRLKIKAKKENRSLNNYVETVLMDIAYDESEDYELISDLFFVLADKVRRGGSVIVPERTYWHLPCGAESVEIMCEAAGLMVEAPNADTGRVIIAYKD